VISDSKLTANAGEKIPGHLDERKETKRREVTVMKKSKMIGVIVLLVSFALIILGSLADVANAAAKEKTKISIIAARPGDAWYVLSHALSVFINERSTSLRAEVQATAGITDNTRMVAAKPEKYADHLVVTMIPGQSVWGEGKYLPLKIGSMLHSASAWVTLNPNLKKLSDLKGKTVYLQRKVRYNYVWIFVDLLEQEGVWQSVKALHGGIASGLTALQDGGADAASQTINFVYPDKFSPSSGLEELKTRGPLHFLQQGDVKTNIAKIAKACRSDEFAGLNLPNLANVVPAKSLGPNQTEDMAVVSCPVFWAAGKEMPNDVVYEVTRILYGAAKNGDFDKYHMMGKGITPEFLTTSFWDEQEARKNHHPGALKFYDDNGIRLKSFGTLYQKYMK
jgi:TRAP-type uncharacterized transport system substrate-binding protein